MKIPAAAAILLALALTGCSSQASSSAGPSASPTQVKTVLAKDLQFVSLEEAMEILDDAGIRYEARVQGPEGTILEDPKAPSERGKWKALTPMESMGPSPKEEFKEGDSVQILVSPMVEPSSTPTPTPTEPPARKITYLITADGPIATTTFGNMIDGKLSTEQANDVASPFRKVYTFTQDQFEDDFTGFSVTAQAGEGTTKISCQIGVDNNMGEPKVSTGPYAVVSCTR